MRGATAAGAIFEAAVSEAAVLFVAWALALGVVAGPVVGLPEFDGSRLGGVDRSGLVACLALAACSSPRGRPLAGAVGPTTAALATVVLFLPVGAVAGVLDAQDGRPRSAAFAALLLLLAFGLAWSAERARRERRSALRYAGAWALLLALPAVAATLFAATSSLVWSPLVWSLAPREPGQALGPSAVVAVVLGLVAVRVAPREA